MPRKFRNLSISILKSSAPQDFTFEPTFDQSNTYSAPPMSAPPTTLTIPKDLFPVNEACESCDACVALAGQQCRNSHRELQSTNGLGSASSTRRRTMLDANGASSPTMRNFSRPGKFQRHPTILPTRHRGAACRVPNNINVVPEHDLYDTQRSASLSNESSPATTPTDERSSTGLDSPLRSMSLGSLSLGSASTLDLSSSPSPSKPSGPRFRFIDRSFF